MFMSFEPREVFRALGDPHRLEMLYLLSAGPLSVGRIARHFQMTQPAVSHHLAVLRRAGCVTVEKRGQQVYYALNSCCLEDCCRDLFRRLKLKSSGRTRRSAR